MPRALLLLLAGALLLPCAPARATTRAPVPRAACVQAGNPPVAVFDATVAGRRPLSVKPGPRRWGGLPAYNQLKNFPWAELRVMAKGSASNPNPVR